MHNDKMKLTHTGKFSQRCGGLFTALEQATGNVRIEMGVGVQIHQVEAKRERPCRVSHRRKEYPTARIQDDRQGAHAAIGGDEVQPPIVVQITHGDGFGRESHGV